MGEIKKYREDYKIELGLRINKARNDKGLSILDLAIGLDVDPRMICYYESGKRGISLDKLILVCNILDISIESLLSN
ncbi:MAG: helix-turn-helix transcriptional regulator [Acholeplasma sp.]|nr:helix-turn-helix transcriptional regulator [Acholeplasma sp.]